MDRRAFEPVSGFTLHSQLAADTTLVRDLDICRCLLMEDSRFPWLILVPRIADLRELHEVPRAQRETLFNEIAAASQALERVISPHKINVAALGNQVPQLHIHVIARNTDDAAWPNPVWGSGAAEPYGNAAREALLDQLNASFD